MNQGVVAPHCILVVRSGNISCLVVTGKMAKNLYIKFVSMRKIEKINMSYPLYKENTE